MEEALIYPAALEFILAASRKLHPREFTGQIRFDEGVISEVLVIPKSVYGIGFASTRLDFIPIDLTIKGSVHSHPTCDFTPSSADERFFRKLGLIHLIARYPFMGLMDVAAYNNLSERVALKVYDGK